MAKFFRKRRGRKLRPRRMRKRRSTLRRTRRTGGRSSGTKFAASAFFPQKKLVKFTWYGFSQQNPGANVAGNRDIDCNNAFSPNPLAASEQPRGWDQWTPMYNNYRVKSSVLVTTWDPAVSGMFGQVLVNKSNLAISDTTVRTMAESFGSRVKTLNLASGTGNKGLTKIVALWDDSMYPPDIARSSRSATVVAKPAFVPQYKIRTVHSNPAEDGGVVDIQLKLTLVVEFFNPKRVAAS